MSLATLEAALSAGQSLLLDTSVIVAYLRGTETASPVASHIIDEFLGSGRNPAVVSPVTALELLVDPLKRGDDNLYRNVLFFLTHSRHVRVPSIALREAHEAAVLRAGYGFKAPDALIIAAGQTAGAEHLVTNDAEWKRKLPTGSNHPSICYLADHLPFP